MFLHASEFVFGVILMIASAGVFLLALKAVRRDRPPAFLASHFGTSMTALGIVVALLLGFSLIVMGSFDAVT